MDEDLKELLDTLPMGKGKLAPWEPEIFVLKQAGASLLQIVDFLKKKGVRTNSSEVHHFIHRKKRQELLEQAKAAPRTIAVPNDKQSTKAASKPASVPATTPAVDSGKSSNGENDAERIETETPKKADEATSTPVASKEKPTDKPKGLPKFTWDLEEERKKPILW